MNRQAHRPWLWWHGIVLGALLLGGCVAPLAATPAASESAATEHEEVHEEVHEHEEAVLAETLPALTPVALEGRKLRVVATTNLVGDAVARVGGENIELTTLLAPGVDPHGYQLTPGDRQQLEDADIILINGLALEAGMLPVLAELAERVPVVAVSVGIDTLAFGEHEEHADEEHEDEEHESEEHEDADHEHEEDEHAAHGDEEAHHHHEGADPHTWQSVPNVIVWTENIATTLSALDPAHGDDYAAAATSYQDELAALNTELHALVDTLPAAQRTLVTDHDSFGYFAHEYGFTVIGTVIPSLSTVAAASARELAALQEQMTAAGVKAIFVGTTVNAQLATQLAADLGIQVVPIYTGSLSDDDGLAPTYVDFMRYNMQTIVDALHD